jgi:Flp pilus assembly protein TadG
MHPRNSDRSAEPEKRIAAPEERRVSETRRRKQLGHALMEGGLVLIPFFGLFFAIVDYGMAIFLRNTFQHAVREGVRYAVTYQTLSPSTGQDTSIKSVVQTNAMGFLNGTNANLIQIHYYDGKTLVETGANTPGNIVEVSVQGYQWGVIAPLLRSASPITLNAFSSDRMEALPDGVFSPPAR